MDNLTEMLKGVLEGCVLEIIGREETYGYEITRRTPSCCAWRRTSWWTPRRSRPNWGRRASSTR